MNFSLETVCTNIKNSRFNMLTVFFPFRGRYQISLHVDLARVLKWLNNQCNGTAVIAWYKLVFPGWPFLHICTVLCTHPKLYASTHRYRLGAKFCRVTVLYGYWRILEKVIIHIYLNNEYLQDKWLQRTFLHLFKSADDFNEKIMGRKCPQIFFCKI